MLHETIARLNDQRMRSYQADPGLLKEHFGVEQTVLAGGYGYRQILELVQNGADALLEAHQKNASDVSDGRIHVLLRESRLYVANTGAPLMADGVDALLRSHSSTKRSNQIGRFGLGFKSLLRLNGRIDVFSRQSGAIRFDPHACRETLCREFQVSQAPSLRIAWPLEEKERDADPVLSGLNWAETIVRVEVGTYELLDHIRKEIQSFPAEFLLFFPLQANLCLDDGDGSPRAIRVEHSNNDRLLHDGALVSRWRIATRQVRMDNPQAKADATHIHERESVPVSWAIPLEGRREEVGRFWAFFPTKTISYLPGILNAPWKLNSDRNAIISGEWNSALMKEAAKLVAEVLPSLTTPSDPAGPLDAFPRQVDRSDVDAAPLIDSLWNILVDAEVIPDGNGVLQRPTSLLRHPVDKKDLAIEWFSLANGPLRQLLVHASCLERQRASRLNFLADQIAKVRTGTEPAGLARCAAKRWLEGIASADAPQFIRTLKLADALSGEIGQSQWNTVYPMLAIIPTQTNGFATSAEVVLAPAGVEVPGFKSIAAGVLDEPEAHRLLKYSLRVREPDEQLWKDVLKNALQDIGNEKDEAGWRNLWACLRLAPDAVCKSFVASARNPSIRVRRRDGRWQEVEQVLLPGHFVDDADEENAGVLLDNTFHSQDEKILDWLNVRWNFYDSEPLIHAQWKTGFVDWHHWCDNHWYQSAYQRGPRPNRNYLQALDGSVPKGTAFLRRLQGGAKARLTLALCKLLPRVSVDGVVYGHATRKDAYPQTRVPHPLPWLLLRHGEVVLAGDSRIPLRALVARISEPAIQRFPICNDLAQALDCLAAHLPSDLVSSDDLRVLWNTAFVESISADQVHDDLWIGAGKDGIVPKHVPSSTGFVPLNRVLVTTSPDLSSRARASGRSVFVLDAPSMNAWLREGARNLADLVGAEWDDIAGPAERLVDVLPELRDVVPQSVYESARCQSVRNLRLRVDGAVEPTPCLLWEGTLRTDSQQLAPLSRATRFHRIVTEIATAGWLNRSAKEALEYLGDFGVESRREYVAAGATLAERLLRAVGNRKEPLLGALGEPLCQVDFIQDCTVHHLAELVLAQLGPAALLSVRDAMDGEGLNPPQRWGTPTAQAFVSIIGFPPHFASSTVTRRDPEELVSGPIALPSLHEFQKEVLHNLEELLASNSNDRRAVVSLPTGGGKTRVTVEAAVRLVLAPKGASRSVLWIAQTDELCEQAVQAFRQVWINLGAQRTNLWIARLWGGNPNPLRGSSDSPIVVVASIQSLSSRSVSSDLDWLRQASLVVIDECHHAIAPSYTTQLRWLNAEPLQPGAAERSQPVIVGLSATPFRRNDEESQRLAKRFGQRWFPANQEELYARLQAQGVLASANYEPIETGVGLTDDEVDKLEGFPEPWEGFDFENFLESVNQRLAADSTRNERLVDIIQQSAEQSILFFCNSVTHAFEMAARLNLAGIRAAAISGGTPPVVRRHFLDLFQSGEIRVLCNHSVLTTGFDAPRTDMVLIARQVFSPVRYMQMVGRGLRGEKNGGTASCRIVSVIDNLGRFADRHPYRYCMNLYH